MVTYYHVNPQGTKLSEIWIKIQSFILKKIHVKNGNKMVAILLWPQCAKGFKVNIVLEAPMSI